mgnify:CR=1 FL=1
MSTPAWNASTAVIAVKCGRCRDVIYSRARHDMHHCTCTAIFVDGGFDYLRVGYSGEVPPEEFRILVAASPEELYNDWDTGANMFGKIRELVV